MYFFVLGALQVSGSTQPLFGEKVSCVRHLGFFLAVFKSGPVFKSGICPGGHRGVVVCY